MSKRFGMLSAQAFLLGALAVSPVSADESWKALALNQWSGHTGFVENRPTQEAAEADARNRCGGSCDVVVSAPMYGTIVTIYCTNGNDDQYAAGAVEDDDVDSAFSQAGEQASWFDVDSMCTIRKVR